MERAEVEALRRRVREKVGAGTPAVLAIERKEWELAALHILLNSLEILEEVGPEAFEALLDELDPGLGREMRNEKRGNEEAARAE